MPTLHVMQVNIAQRTRHPHPTQVRKTPPHPTEQPTYLPPPSTAPQSSPSKYSIGYLPQVPDPKYPIEPTLHNPTHDVSIHPRPLHQRPRPKMLLASLLVALLPAATKLSTSFFDKIGFNLDVTGRQREIAILEEQARLTYGKAGISVNVAVWNMHVPVTHQFEGILESGLLPMGKGGGFRVVVFTGEGWLVNQGNGGEDNWKCSGRVVRKGNEVRFKARGSWGWWGGWVGRWVGVLGVFVLGEGFYWAGNTGE